MLEVMKRFTMKQLFNKYCIRLRKKRWWCIHSYWDGCHSWDWHVDAFTRPTSDRRQRLLIGLELWFSIHNYRSCYQRDETTNNIIWRRRIELSLVCLSAPSVQPSRSNIPGRNSLSSFSFSFLRPEIFLSLKKGAGWCQMLFCLLYSRIHEVQYISTAPMQDTVTRDIFKSHQNQDFERRKI